MIFVLWKKLIETSTQQSFQPKYWWKLQLIQYLKAIIENHKYVRQLSKIYKFKKHGTTEQKPQVKTHGFNTFISTNKKKIMRSRFFLDLYKVKAFQYKMV